MQVCRCVFETPQSRVETLHDLASMLHKSRNFRAARRVFDVYFNSQPKPTPTKELCSMLGLSCTAMGDIKDGVGWYKKAITMDPGFKDAWLNLFQAYKEGGFVRARPASTQGRQRSFCVSNASHTHAQRLSGGISCSAIIYLC